MNNEISNLRPHCSQIVKLILFFYSGGAHFLFFFLFLSLIFVSSHFRFSFLSFSFLSCSEPTISLLSLSLCSTSLPPSPMKPRSEHQAKPISIAASSFFFFFFLVCDLMVYSAVVVWVCDLVLDGYGLWWADGGGYLFNGFLRWTGGGWWWVGMSFMVWFWVWVCDLILGLFLLVILVAGGWGCARWCLAVGVVLVMNFWPWMVMGHRFGWVN